MDNVNNLNGVSNMGHGDEAEAPMEEVAAPEAAPEEEAPVEEATE